MRSRGIGIPAFWASCSMDSTKSACLSLSGVNLLNMGSNTHGAISTSVSTKGTEANQKYSHHVRGFHRITPYIMSATIAVSTKPISSALVQSQNHEPHPWTDC